jgi:CRISPR-associated endonuclease Cas3-HD
MKNNINDFIANSQGQTLINHSLAVANLARAMAEYVGVSNDILDKIYCAGLLHDIGKVPCFIQDYLKSKYDELSLCIISEDDDNDPITDKPFHNEIGWAFLWNKMNDREILNAIYWHHAQRINVNSNIEYNTIDDIDKCLDNDDKDKLEEFFNEIKKYIPESIVFKPCDRNESIPNLFDEESISRNNNARFMIIRACVISADRYISSLEKDEVTLISDNYEVCHDIVNNILLGSIEGNVKLPDNYDRARFDLQNNIINDIDDHRTSLVKAPAGLGKTMIGILWAKKRGGKSLWICPRNSVATAVYDNIKKEIDAIGLECSIELYLTGERKKTNVKDNRKEFDSDIIVTNIDALLSPMVNNRVAERLFSVYSSNVILDEFHEFISNAPMFAAFIIYMNVRNKLTNCKTLLLSATPTNVNIFWDGSADDKDKTTLILPDKDSHYSPQHYNNYTVNFMDSLPCKAIDGSLLVCNAVTEAQSNYSKGYTYIIHHNYTDGDRETKENAIKSAFDKNGNGLKNGESLSAALVVQAAMDISFRELIDSVSSPESTLQRIGRINRWGTLDNSVINFIDLSNQPNERGAINSTYEKDLQKRWYSFLKEKIQNKSSINLEILYCLYNEFYHNNKKELYTYLTNQYSESIKSLVEFKPKKIINMKDKKVKQYSKSLRSPDGSWFYTVEVDGESGTWITLEDVLSCNSDLYKRYSKDIDLSNYLQDVSKMTFILKSLVQHGYIGWEKYVKKHGSKLPRLVKEWFKIARNPETPLPDLSRKYNKEVGVRKNLDL